MRTMSQGMIHNCCQYGHCMSIKHIKYYFYGINSVLTYISCTVSSFAFTCEGFVPENPYPNVHNALRFHLDISSHSRILVLQINLTAPSKFDHKISQEVQSQLESDI